MSAGGGDIMGPGVPAPMLYGDDPAEEESKVRSGHKSGGWKFVLEKSY